jgi:hypothetical protein
MESKKAFFPFWIWAGEEVKNERNGFDLCCWNPPRNHPGERHDFHGEREGAGVIINQFGKPVRR